MELEVEKELAETLNDCSIDAIIALNTDRNIIAWNRTAEIIYGKLKAEALGKPLTEIFPALPEDTETIHAIDLAFKGHKSFVPASKLHTHRLHVENHYIPLTNKTGITGIMNIVHDVAHRIKAEQQLQALNDKLEKQYRQLQKTSAELASFTFVSSNNIKQPIRQVYTAVEHLIKTEAERLTDTGKAAFRRIQASLNRMNLLLDDILSLAQISILEKPDKLINLNNLLEDVITGLQKQITETNANITLKEPCSIYGHEKQLHLLFYHLLDNAIKFNESKTPYVTIECKKMMISPHPDVAFSERKYYRVTIADNGIGFEQSDAERIFTMFEKLHTGKYKGSGMGLTIARKIMDAHDGFIQAENNPEKGSCFHCFFPAIFNDD